MFKNIFIIFALCLSLGFSQNVFFHREIYFKTPAEVVSMLGEPLYINTVAFENGILYVYPMESYQEILWVVFGNFGE